jgi:hypothetical protein
MVFRRAWCSGARIDFESLVTALHCRFEDWKAHEPVEMIERGIEVSHITIKQTQHNGSMDDVLG